MDIVSNLGLLSRVNPDFSVFPSKSNLFFVMASMPLSGVRGRKFYRVPIPIPVPDRKSSASDRWRHRTIPHRPHVAPHGSSTSCPPCTLYHLPQGEDSCIHCTGIQKAQLVHHLPESRCSRSATFVLVVLARTCLGGRTRLGRKRPCHWGVRPLCSESPSSTNSREKPRVKECRQSTSKFDYLVSYPSSALVFRQVFEGDRYDIQVVSPPPKVTRSLGAAFEFPQNFSEDRVKVNTDAADVWF